MNYGKRNSVKKQKKISSKSKMKKKRAGVRIFKGFLIVFLLLYYSSVLIAAVCS